MKGHRATETPTATRFSIRVSVACRIIREREEEKNSINGDEDGIFVPSL